MPAILTNNLSVINAENFVDSFINGDSNIYMAIGRGYDNEEDKIGDYKKDQWEEWSDKNNPSIDESNPPTPRDTIAEQNDFRTSIIGIKRVQINNIMLMIPRIDWKAGMIFKPINTASIAGTRATDYFCINSNNEVWMCIGTPKENNAVTKDKSEPLLSSDKVIQNKENKMYELTTTDGYTWRYMYNILASVVNSGMLLENWMPVPFNKHGVYPGGMLTETQEAKGDVNANRTLGAYRVLVTATLRDEGDKIPYSAIYRQIGLIVDPLDTAGNFLTGDVYADTEFDVLSGELVYLENKSPIHREEGQNETLNLLLIF
jgi:hypothetical protein